MLVQLLAKVKTKRLPSALGLVPKGQRVESGAHSNSRTTYLTAVRAIEDCIGRAARALH